jgi:pentapeptide repeat protein
MRIRPSKAGLTSKTWSSVTMPFFSANTLMLANFSGARFAGVAIFDGTTFSNSARFGRCRFEGDAWFSSAHTEAMGFFEEAVFQAGVSFARAKADGSLLLRKARFEAARDLGGVTLAQEFELDDAVFVEHVAMAIEAPFVSCQNCQFREGGAILASDLVDLAGASFGAPAVLGPTTTDREDSEVATRGVAEPRLRGINGANVEQLVISGYDLSGCRFAGVHNLDRLRIENRARFAHPPDNGLWSQRRTIFEEHLWRARHGFPGWIEGDLDKTEAAIEAEDISALYRALRKGREDARDHPGAADFYFGEMEMRRHAWKPPRQGSPPSSRTESRLVFLYWLLSGYGLRALPPFVALATLLLLAAVAVDAWGFRPDENFGRAVIFAVGSGVAFGAAPTYELTPTGDVVRIVLRILGPVLLGFALLALRNRVRR